MLRLVLLVLYLTAPLFLNQGPMTSATDDTGRNLDPNGADIGGGLDPNGSDIGGGWDPDGSDTSHGWDPNG